MKCDELRDFEVVLSTEYQFVGGVVFRSKKFYSKDSVDEAIDELKAENEKLNKTLDKERSETIKYMDELCNAKNEIERLTIDKRNAELRADVADATVEKLQAKNAELKAKLENRRLKRALWRARADRADDRARIFYFNDLETMLDIDGFSYDSKKKKGCKKLIARKWRIIWEKVERKCRAKAEEYK